MAHPCSLSAFQAICRAVVLRLCLWEMDLSRLRGFQEQHAL
jgi:hypothetical protein